VVAKNDSNDFVINPDFYPYLYQLELAYVHPILILPLFSKQISECL